MKSLYQYLIERLPAIYQSNELVKNFFRLLCFFAVDWEDTINKIQHILDADVSPQRFLRWLATWVALDLDLNWSVAKQREAILNMVDLYKWRGTKKGIEDFVTLYTDLPTVVIEHEITDPLHGWQVGVTSTVGVNLTIYGGEQDIFTITVKVVGGAFLSEFQKEKVSSIIISQKPAHAKIETILFTTS